LFYLLTYGHIFAQNLHLISGLPNKWLENGTFNENGDLLHQGARLSKNYK